MVVEKAGGLERFSKIWSFILRVSGVESDPIYMAGAAV